MNFDKAPEIKNKSKICKNKKWRLTFLNRDTWDVKVLEFVKEKMPPVENMINSLSKTAPGHWVLQSKQHC